ncbi:MAG: protein TolR [Gammaproteobacteria bacterium]|nr:protein TolR [Gammaproteobacteria bacterium]
MAARRKPMSEINVVPYIDVMLVLLVIFMVTAPLTTQGVEVDLPSADSAPLSNEEDPLVITVNANGDIFVNTGMPRPGAEGTRATIFSLLDQAEKILEVRPDLPVYVRGDQGVTYGEVVRVMSVLQRAGAGSIGLITDPVESLEPGGDG